MSCYTETIMFVLISLLRCHEHSMSAFKNFNWLNYIFLFVCIFQKIAGKMIIYLEGIKICIFAYEYALSNILLHQNTHHQLNEQ